MKGTDAGSSSASAEAYSTQLVIGAHRLEGNAKPWPKPLLVLRKTSEGGKTSYKVVGQVNKRLLFKTRPKPIVRKAREGKA
ncbi:unnamed protein product [Chrysoparadoxa australica]